MPRSTSTESDVDDRLAEALEQVVHGAAVSVPSSLIGRALTVALTAVLTNGFTASAYGFFVLARRIQRYLANLVLGFRRGLNRFIPNVDSAAKRDVVATFATALSLGIAVCFGIGLYVAAPEIVAATGKGRQFRLYLRIFALGLPATVLAFTTAELLRALEAVVPFNATVRITLPGAQLIAVVVGTLFLSDLALVAGGILTVTGLVGVAAAAWLARSHGVRPRIRSSGARALRRRYLRFTVPLFLEGFATQTQRLGYYPLIAVFLSGTAGGVFAVGALIGGLVRLPLMGINQFISPVAASLYEEGHHQALRRLYQVTSRLALAGVIALAVPMAVFRRPVMAVFGETFAAAAWVLPGFLLAMVSAAAAGSVGFLMSMTDNQRELLAVNVIVTVLLIPIAVSLTVTHGLAGLVGTYLLMVVLNNGLEVLVLARVEGLHPFTAAHLKPVVAAVAFAAVALAARTALSATMGAVAGTLFGLAVYATVLHGLGFSRVERRLATALWGRYRSALDRIVHF